MAIKFVVFVLGKRDWPALNKVRDSDSAHYTFQWAVVHDYSTVFINPHALRGANDVRLVIMIVPSFVL